jgi:hypothetical protein
MTYERRERKVVPVLCNEDVWGVEVQLHHSCRLHYMELGGELHVAAALPARLGGLQSLCGRYREQKTQLNCPTLLVLLVQSVFHLDRQQNRISAGYSSVAAST